MLSLALALVLSAVPLVTVSGNVLAPDGTGMASGSIACRLTTPGSAWDGTRMARVASEYSATLTPSSGAITMPLVPNDAISPTGTRYTCAASVVTAAGRRYTWSEQWQLASFPTTQDIGSVQIPRYALGACMPAAAPTILPGTEAVTAAQTISLSANTPGSWIYYTVDGRTPTTSSQIYSTPFTVSGDTTVRAVAAPLYGWSVSDVASRTYTLASEVEAIPFTSSGVAFDDDAAGLTHLTWNGTALQDSKALGWTMTGTVPQVAAAVLPYLSAGGGAGPISGSNRYSFGAGSDALDVANFEACISFVPAAIGTTQGLFCNGNVSTTGYCLFLSASGTCDANVGGTTISTANTAGVGPNVCCFGRSGTTGSVRLNLGSVVTATVTASVDTARGAYLGCQNGATNCFGGKLVEFKFLPSPYDDAWAQAQVVKHFGHFGSRGEPLAVTRGAASAVVNGTSWSFPANVIRMTGTGSYDTGVSATGPALPLASWCATGTWKPDVVAWTAADATLWSRGTPAAANSARLRSLDDGQFSCEVYDGTATPRTATWSHGYLAGSSHQVQCCNASGTVGLYSDGVLVGSSTAGGTGAWSTAPTAETWGAPSTAGWVKSARVCRGGLASACQ